ncbi:hypothetical protein BU25DRAFT_487056 [Macroventuria anomochaeta]|uniref:Uncharacterized protein n=1 Tax=Macroventuria anomochaeta TaxID=301207 RepID=A0ACB6SGX5_9PLEO|nr:uncharacterized protein BU25DRAFT_487056 [Macroventuria anomochaeta]KAF2632588.1 hypothetical protein BU25DRAFT_487056 [Macroventuria anomochaeta]
MDTSIMSHNPTRPSPLSRKSSPFKDPRPAPCTPAKTARAWDEYEKQARQNARRRDRASQSCQPHRNSASSDVGKGSRSSSSTARSSYDFKFRNAPIATSTEVATCKSCKQPITYASGICERCKKTIILPSPTGESTPPLSPAARNFASTDLHLLEKSTSQEEQGSRPSSSPKRKGCPPALKPTNPPVRLDSLRPPPNTQDLMEANRSRKASLTDPNEPFLRLQYAHQYAPYTYSIPTTPTYPPTSPPSTIPSRVSTRPSSFSQMTSSLTQSAIMPSYTRQNSATPSELSQLHHYAPVPLAATSPPSLYHVNNGPQNTTSAWDDWDSDGEEKVRLVGYWKRSGKDKSTTHVSTSNFKSKEKERSRADSKISYSSSEEHRSHEKHDKKSKSSLDRKSEEKRSKESSRSQSRMGKRSETKTSSTVRESYKKHKKRPSGLTRFLSCGC